MISHSTGMTTGASGSAYHPARKRHSLQPLSTSSQSSFSKIQLLKPKSQAHSNFNQTSTPNIAAPLSNYGGNANMASNVAINPNGNIPLASHTAKKIASSNSNLTRHSKIAQKRRSLNNAPRYPPFLPHSGTPQHESMNNFSNQSQGHTFSDHQVNPSNIIQLFDNNKTAIACYQFDSKNNDGDLSSCEKKIHGGTSLRKSKKLRKSFNSGFNNSLGSLSNINSFIAKNKEGAVEDKGVPIIIRLLSNYGDSNIVEWSSIVPLNLEKKNINVLSVDIKAPYETHSNDIFSSHIDNLPIDIEVYLKEKIEQDKSNLISSVFSSNRNEQNNYNNESGFSGSLSNGMSHSDNIRVASFSNDLKYIRFTAPFGANKKCIKEVEVLSKNKLIWKGEISPDFGSVADLMSFQRKEEEIITKWEKDNLNKYKQMPKYYDKHGIIPLNYIKELKLTFLSNYSGRGSFTLTGLTIFVLPKLNDSQARRFVRKSDIKQITYKNTDVETPVDIFFNDELFAKNISKEEDDNIESNNSDYNDLKSSNNMNRIMTLHRKVNDNQVNDGEHAVEKPLNPEIIITFKKRLIVEEIRFNNFAQLNDKQYCSKGIKISLDDIPVYIGKLKAGNQSDVHESNYITQIFLNKVSSFEAL
ncbi:hypothetical protein TRFO_29533 [Tritrichomonas foetus]|uniref:KATNIP domain-containing protein n=1 Tax=Tritrichomonas foetus TaxID=1144522 RepID=A0A1J4K0B2_9EUKA|nr:hypothetical protein TRFO_29533 [Tritrichomonas foetus]|eukprot:OHT03212.1 hypothetical protein TRFO_29533 [Tritrichomonas foetus]